MKTKPLALLLATLILLALGRPTPCHGQGQIFVRDFTGGFGPTTNSLTPVPNAGVLTLRYDFLAIPDTLDVFYGTQHIFSTGLTNGFGQYDIPYGPGLANNLDIIVNMNGDLVGSVWQFSTAITVPEPRPLPLLTLAAVIIFFCRRTIRHHRTSPD